MLIDRPEHGGLAQRLVWIEAMHLKNVNIQMKGYKKKTMLCKLKYKKAVRDVAKSWDRSECLVFAIFAVQFIKILSDTVNEGVSLILYLM